MSNIFRLNMKAIKGSFVGKNSYYNFPKNKCYLNYISENMKDDSFANIRKFFIKNQVIENDARTSDFFESDFVFNKLFLGPVSSYLENWKTYVSIDTYNKIMTQFMTKIHVFLSHAKQNHNISAYELTGQLQEILVSFHNAIDFHKKINNTIESRKKNEAGTFPYKNNHDIRVFMKNFNEAVSLKNIENQLDDHPIFTPDEYITTIEKTMNYISKNKLSQEEDENQKLIGNPNGNVKNIMQISDEYQSTNKFANRSKLPKQYIGNKKMISELSHFLSEKEALLFSQFFFNGAKISENISIFSAENVGFVNYNDNDVFQSSINRPKQKTPFSYLAEISEEISANIPASTALRYFLMTRTESHYEKEWLKEILNNHTPDGLAEEISLFFKKVNAIYIAHQPKYIKSVENHVNRLFDVDFLIELMKNTGDVIFDKSLCELFVKQQDAFFKRAPGGLTREVFTGILKEASNMEVFIKDKSDVSAYLKQTFGQYLTSDVLKELNQEKFEIEVPIDIL